MPTHLLHSSSFLVYQNFLLICTAGCAFCWSLLNKLSLQLLWIHCKVSVHSDVCDAPTWLNVDWFARGDHHHCNALQPCTVAQMLHWTLETHGWVASKLLQCALWMCGAPDLTRICALSIIKLHPLNPVWWAKLDMDNAEKVQGTVQLMIWVGTQWNCSLFDF